MADKKEIFQGDGQEPEFLDAQDKEKEEQKKEIKKTLDDAKKVGIECNGPEREDPLDKIKYVTEKLHLAEPGDSLNEELEDKELTEAASDPYDALVDSFAKVLEGAYQNWLSQFGGEAEAYSLSDIEEAASEAAFRIAADL